MGLLALLGLVSLHLAYAEPCAELLCDVQFHFPKDKTELVTIKVGKTAKELRGKLTPGEVIDVRSDREIWDRLKVTDSKVAPGRGDIVIYPANGVDLGLPITVMGGAGLYIGVDIESGIPEDEVRALAADPKFNPAKLFSATPYLLTIPMMIAGAAGDGTQFTKSFLKNIVTILPDDAVIESLTFVLDRQTILHRGEVRKTGPHTLLTWSVAGRRQSALLLSTSMPLPADGKGQWWFDELERLKPAYAVMKRPQGFSFDEVYAHLCEWVRSKGGMIVAEGESGNIGLEEKTKACLESAVVQQHVITSNDVKRGGAIFGFSRSALLFEVLGPKQKAAVKSSASH